MIDTGIWSKLNIIVLNLLEAFRKIPSVEYYVIGLESPYLNMHGKLAQTKSDWVISLKPAEAASPYMWRAECTLSLPGSTSSQRTDIINCCDLDEAVSVCEKWMSELTDGTYA